MPRPKVFITRVIDQEALDAIGAETEMEVWPDEFPPSAGALREKMGEAHGLVTTVMDRVDNALLDSAPRLKVVSQMAVGVNNVDVAELTRRGIPLGYTPDVLSGATADLAFALLLAAARRVVETDRWVRAGNWKLAFHPTYWLGADVGGATLGIVGLGKIGLEVARRARGFGMKLLYCSRTRKVAEEAELGMEYTDLPTLLRRSDFVSVHVPLTPRDPPPDRRRRAVPDETHRHTDQHRPGPGGGLESALRRTEGRQDRGRRAGRHRPGAHTRRRPTAHSGQPCGDAPHRQRLRRLPQGHGDAGRPEPASRPEGRAVGTVLQPGGVWGR